jgi:hypothetical protein
MTDPGWDLMDHKSMAALVLERLKSREWWLLVPLGENGNSVISTIEEKYYSGEANTDFHLVLDNNSPVWAFYLARKSRMSAGQLAEMFLEPEDTRRELEDSLGSRDLVLVGAQPGSQGVLQANAFLRWFRETIGGGGES